MRIGEIEALTGLSAGTIRYWEERGLVSFERAGNSYREIDSRTVKLLERIKLFRKLGIALADIKLWRDGLINERELLVGRLAELEKDSRSNLDQRSVCEKLLSGEELSDTASLDQFFSETVERPGRLSLGVDIGTTTLSATLVSLEDGATLHTYTIDHHAAIESDDTEAFMADAEKLVKLAIGLVNSAVDAYPEIVSIGFTGQMHGIVCLGADGGILSPLYTWQNRFGLRKRGESTICEKIAEKTGKNVPSGYGIVTYYALRELGLLPEGCGYISCIADLAAARLCENKKIAAHPTNAASLGLFDISANDFDSASLEALGIDRSVLPEIIDDFVPVGYFRGIPVSAAIGDNQAGVFGSISGGGDVLLNVGTSGQVSFVSEKTEALTDDPCCEVRPYFGGEYLHSGSTLCGGRAFAGLYRLVSEIIRHFGVDASKDEIYEYLSSEALRAKGELCVSTLFAGSRAEPEAKGSISGITLETFDIAELSDGFARGIIDELYRLFVKMGGECRRLIVSGNAMRKNPALRRAAMKRFGAEPLIPSRSEEAAFGTTLYAAVSARLSDVNNIKNLISYRRNTK